MLARVFAPRRMGMLVLLGIGGLAFIGVPMNALFLQDGHHPAPLFAHAVVPQKAEVSDADAAPARPAQTETDHAAADAKPEALKNEIATPAVRPARSDATALKALLSRPETASAGKVEKKREPAVRDPISAMLGGSEARVNPQPKPQTKPQAHALAPSATPAKALPQPQPKTQPQAIRTQTPAPKAQPQPRAQAPKTQAQTEPAAPSENVAASQRALQRLGYVVKPDGVPNAGTRQAIEKFEKENGLPAKGELTHKITRLLAIRAAAPHQ